MPTYTHVPTSRLLCQLSVYLSIMCSSQFAFGQLDAIALSEGALEIVEAEGSLRILNNEEAIYSESYTITILSPESVANEFEVGYDSENRILKMDADIYDMSGKAIRKVKKDEIRDYLAYDGFSVYNDNRIKSIELNHSEYPYVVKFSYEQRLRGLSFAALPNWWFQPRASSAVSRSTFTLQVPEDMSIQHKVYNTDLEPTITSDSKSTTYQWTAARIPASLPEPFDPPAHEKYPVLRLSINEFKIDNYEGSMASWENYGTFMYQLWEGRNAISPELATKVHELTDDASDDSEKIDRLYKFMQEEKRYVSIQLGIGGWQTYSAEYVEERGYGDCKALSNYMGAMLKEVGIISYPVIIAAGFERPYTVENDFVNLAFNHVILYLPEQDMWLECTSNTSPTGYLSDWTHDRRVLLITPEGGRLARTPKLTAEDNFTHEQVGITLATDGSAQIDYEGNYRGEPQDHWRYYDYGFTQEEIQDEVRNIGKLPNLNLGEVTITPDPNHPITTLAFSAEAKRYASRAGKRLFVPLNTICPLQGVPEPLDERVYPLVLPLGKTKETAIHFMLPAGYRVESLPDSVSIESPFGSYQLNVSEHEGIVVLERAYRINAGDHPAESYTDFRAFLLAIVKADGAKMVLVAE